MSQARMLPDQIVANLFAPHDGNTVKYNMETAEKVIREYAYENIMCWDDFVIAFGADKLKKHK